MSKDFVTNRPGAEFRISFGLLSPLAWHCLYYIVCRCGVLTGRETDRPRPEGFSSRDTVSTLTFHCTVLIVGTVDYCR